MASTAFSPSEWSELFVAAAGASAALLGLIFVAVSINLDSVLSSQGLPERALMTLLLLLGVLVVSLFGLVPGQSRTALGLELLAQGLVWSAAVIVLTSKSLAGPSRPSWVVSRYVLAALGTVPFAVGGASLLAEWGGGLYWTSTGVVGATIGGVLNAWVFLVEIKR